MIYGSFTTYFPRRMAGAAALCAAVAYSVSLQPPARQDAHRTMGGDVRCALLIPDTATSVRKQQRGHNRMDSWLVTRRHLQQEYVLEGVIGEGGFGLVHVGRHRGSNARVAIKRVSKQRTTRENFLQEVAILQQVGGTHNVLALREAFETSDAYVLVTELVTGGELYDDLVQHGVFEEDRAKDLVRELASTLEYLHSRKVVHADLKPENILLSRDNETGLRLIDFGQSFRLNDNSRPQLDVCTTAYASPEVMQHRTSGCAMDMKNYKNEFSMEILTVRLRDGLVSRTVHKISFVEC
ncbi:camk protein kinase [Plasmopara halstedii]|uniref:Camk protein kinase n=1 Tax=Plasmopara halstedii TaxID=4781 RepID=A0A0P1AAE5_PLAHL|nr:camk protein kinase [Plasmopara halstedii]CEG37532.1 camk protein kinase [Plasmopara halstedii]|eukprot:XP_024573901.1 camk protein kinase [Plasmopara halstedii]